MFVVYILYSESHSKTYTGCTADLISRFHSHNTHSNTDWTRSYRPWIVLHCEYLETKAKALKREKELKSGKGRDWIKSQLEHWLAVFG